MESDSKQEPTIKDEQLSFIGQDLTEIPVDWGVRFGSTTKRIDLSYNQLT